jgi:hypothetical protein
VRAYFSSTPDAWEGYECYWEPNSTGNPLSLEEAYDDQPGPMSIVHFLSVTAPATASPPDTLYYAGWSLSYGAAFQVPFGIPDSLAGALDAAVNYMWLDRTVPQDDSVSFTQYLLVYNPALNIMLSQFDAAYDMHEGIVRLAWRTESEDDNLGFNLYRAVGGDEYEKINDEIIPGAGNSSTPQVYGYSDEDINRIGLYRYKLEQVDRNGVKQFHGPVSIDIRNFIPRISSLQSIYPNPFTTGVTTISFAVGLNDAGENVSLRVYDISGRMVRALMNRQQDAGFYSVRWDGRNDAGKKVAVGVYYMVLETGTARKVQKAVLMK